MTPTFTSVAADVLRVLTFRRPLAALSKYWPHYLAVGLFLSGVPAWVATGTTRAHAGRYGRLAWFLCVGLAGVAGLPGDATRDQADTALGCAGVIRVA